MWMESIHRDYLPSLQLGEWLQDAMSRGGTGMPHTHNPPMPCPDGTAVSSTLTIGITVNSPAVSTTPRRIIPSDQLLVPYNRDSYFCINALTIMASL